MFVEIYDEEDQETMIINMDKVQRLIHRGIGSILVFEFSENEVYGQQFYSEKYLKEGVALIFEHMAAEQRFFDLNRLASRL